MPKTQPEPIRDQTSDRLLTPQNCAIALIDYCLLYTSPIPLY